jgi:hypothetical protein
MDKGQILAALRAHEAPDYRISVILQLGAGKNRTLDRRSRKLSP